MHRPALLLLDNPAAGGAVTFAEAEFDAPAVRAMNYAVTRGDGVFESVGVHRGQAHDVEPHLDRLEHSAQLLDLPTPNREAYRAAIMRCVELLADGGFPHTAYVKFVLTRGIEGEESGPTGFAYAGAYPDMTKVRTTPASMVTLSRGFPLNFGAQAPWLLIGAKTLSYASNMATKRHAMALGADEPLLVTSDGFALEGPQSNLLVQRGDTILTPRPEGGLLHGTAQRAAFAFFASRGFATEYADIPVTDLYQADGLWLTNSVQLLRPIGVIDGHEVAFDAELTAALLTYLVDRPEGR